MPHARILAFMLLVTLGADFARAECVSVPPRQIVDAPGTELVFSGRVVEVSQTGGYGARATFQVEQVWKGQVPETFSVFMWYGDSANAPRYAKAESYVVVATRLTDKRARAEVGLADSRAVAFIGKSCSGIYTIQEFVGALGRGNPPIQAAEHRIKR